MDRQVAGAKLTHMEPDTGSRARHPVGLRKWVFCIDQPLGSPMVERPICPCRFWAVSLGASELSSRQQRQSSLEKCRFSSHLKHSKGHQARQCYWWVMKQPDPESWVGRGGDEYCLRIKGLVTEGQCLKLTPGPSRWLLWLRSLKTCGPSSHLKSNKLRLKEETQSLQGQNWVAGLGKYLASCSGLVLILTEFLPYTHHLQGSVGAPHPAWWTRTQHGHLLKVTASQLYFLWFFEEFWGAGDLSFGRLTSWCPGGSFPEWEPVSASVMGPPGGAVGTPQEGPQKCPSRSQEDVGWCGKASCP